MVQRMLRLRDVLRLRGKSKTMHYDDIRAGRFPPGIKIGPKTVVWPESDIEAEQQALLEARTKKAAA
jgi:predicted DNA-binding transcriptional regulator AlpA